jgi:hypothetical protein
MAIKSIIDVEIRDQHFKEFQSLFEKYQKALAQTPAAWRQTQQAIGGSRKEFNEMVAQQSAMATRQKMMLEIERAQARMARTTADAWRDVARHTKETYSGVKDITLSLLRWASLTSVFSGLIGAGGLFGITRMAEGVSATRRSSMGTGLSFGQQKAFNLNYIRVVDPDSFLGGVNQSLTDVSKRSALYNAGLGERELTGGTAAVGVRLLNKLKTLADETPDNLLGNVHGARGLGQYMTAEDFQRLKATSRGELAGLASGFQRDQGALGIGGKDQLAWQNFTTQIYRAGNEIETVFIKGLSPLAPGLEKLSGAVSNTIKAFFGGDDAKGWAEQANKGLETFAKYIGSDEFQSGVVKFAKGIAVIADKLASFVSWFGGDGGGKSSVLGEHEGHDTWNEMWKRSREKRAAIGGGVSALASGGVNLKPGAGALDPGLAKLAGGLQQRIPGINQVTSGNDAYHAGTGSAHADDRAFDINLKDPSQSAEVAAQVRAELSRLGIAGRVIDEYKNPSSRATGGHLHVQTDKKVDIRIFDATGGSVNVQAKQVAQ